MKIFDLEKEGFITNCRKHIFAFLTLFFIILAIYSNTFDASWHLDDGPNITENRRLHLKTLNWPDVKNALFSSPSGSSVNFFRPVSRFSLALNYYVGKDSVFGYHVINILIHGITSLFLYLFIFHTLRLPLLQAKYGPCAYFIALLATILWAINPLHTQAVTYVVQRMACMAGLFYIMAMYFYVKGQVTSSRAAKLAFYISSAAAGLLSFGSKENAILLPVSLILYHLLIVQGFSKENLKKSLKIVTLTCLLPLGASLALLFFSGDAIPRIFGLYEARVFTPWERLLTESRVILFYLGLLLYPVPTRLSVDHDLVISTSLFSPPTNILSILLIISIVLAVSLVSRREPLITFSLFFFFLNHALESTILPMELIFEHRNYLPSMLLFVPIAIGASAGIRYFSYRPSMQVLVSVSLTFVIIAVGHGTFMRNFAWANEETLWLDCVEKYPNSFRAHHNLGRSYQRLGDDQKATEEYEMALKCRETHSRKEKGITYFNLGLIAHKKGEYQRAMTLYSKALGVNPCCPGVHTNLAALLLGPDNKNLEEVRQVLAKAIECGHDAEIPIALSNLGIVLMKMGKSDKAIDTLNKAMEIDPDNPLTLLRLGYAYKEKGLLGRASIYMKKLLGQHPTDITGLLSLAEVYVRAGDMGKCSTILARLVDTVPPDEFILYLRGIRHRKNIIDLVPDMDLLLPFLSEAYHSKALLLERNHQYCLEARGNMK